MFINRHSGLAKALPKVLIAKNTDTCAIFVKEKFVKEGCAVVISLLVSVQLEMSLNISEYLL